MRICVSEKKTQEALGKVIAELDLEILASVYKNFPDLRPSWLEKPGKGI
jgi:hypothetical protein